MSVVESLFRPSADGWVARRACPIPDAAPRTRRTARGGAARGTARGGVAAATLAQLGVALGVPLQDTPESRTPDEKGRPQPPRYERRPGALVIDATGVRTIADLGRAMRGPASDHETARAVGTRPWPLTRAPSPGWEVKAVAQGIDGINRTVAKELARRCHRQPPPAA